MSGWRSLAIFLGVLVTIVGAFVWHAGQGVMFLVFGALMVATAALEPVYGRANGKPRGGSWRRTDERFVDPETGRLVSVWFDPDSGERRYVNDSAAPPAG